MNLLLGVGVINLVLWLIFGALAGWIASMIMKKNSQMGAGSNILFGILGSLVGGFLASLLGLGGVNGFNIGSFLIAVIGACILLWIVNAVKHKAT